MKGHAVSPVGNVVIHSHCFDLQHTLMMAWVNLIEMPGVSLVDNCSRLEQFHFWDPCLSCDLIRLKTNLFPYVRNDLIQGVVPNKIKWAKASQSLFFAKFNLISSLSMTRVNFLWVWPVDRSESTSWWARRAHLNYWNKYGTRHSSSWRDRHHRLAMVFEQSSAAPQAINRLRLWSWRSGYFDLWGPTNVEAPPGATTWSPVARFRFVKTSNSWCIYWMRHTGKWAS
jgi:hypothetical protein